MCKTFKLCPFWFISEYALSDRYLIRGAQILQNYKIHVKV